MTGTADDALFYLTAVGPDGVGTEPATLLRIVAVHKADAATADGRVLGNHLSHDIGQLIWMVQILLNLVHTITRAGRDFSEHPFHSRIDCGQRTPVVACLLH